MKIKLLLFICLILAFVTLTSACNTDGNTPADPTDSFQESTEQPSDTEQDSQKPKPPVDSSKCSHEYVEISKTNALALKEGSAKYQCSICNHSYVSTLPATNSVKILALGNSFTDDSTWHLWNICKGAGIEEVIVANLYVGNCTLDLHWSYITSSQSPYIYRKTTTGTRVDTEKYRVIDALTDEDWDFIVLHQTSGSAGFSNTYSKLDRIIDFFNRNKTNPDAKILWHMPWAYQSDSTHAEFSKYDKDQMKMYNTIVERVNEIILPKDTISAIIPSGTAIQNLRTSYIGDTVTRDGYHLNYGFGRYTAGLTWYAVLTGGDVYATDWTPPEYPEVKKHLPAIRESVYNALNNNFEVIKSTSEPVPPTNALDPHDYIEEDTEMALDYGIDLGEYELLEWEYLYNAYWQCTTTTQYHHPGTSSSTFNQNICSDRKYSVADELPVGTIFICDLGWRFRLEIFPTENEVYKGVRPDGCTDPLYVLTEEFLNGCTYIAWDVSSYPKSDISQIFDQAYGHVRIYVPKN